MLKMHADCSFLQHQWLAHNGFSLVLHIYIYIYIYIYANWLKKRVFIAIYAYM